MADETQEEPVQEKIGLLERIKRKFLFDIAIPTAVTTAKAAGEVKQTYDNAKNGLIAFDQNNFGDDVAGLTKDSITKFESGNIPGGVNDGLASWILAADKMVGGRITGVKPPPTKVAPPPPLPISSISTPVTGGDEVKMANIEQTPPASPTVNQTNKGNSMG